MASFLLAQPPGERERTIASALKYTTKSKQTKILNLKRKVGINIISKETST